MLTIRTTWNRSEVVCVDPRASWCVAFERAASHRPRARPGPTPPQLSTLAPWFDRKQPVYKIEGRSRSRARMELRSLTLCYADTEVNELEGHDRRMASA